MATFTLAIATIDGGKSLAAHTFPLNERFKDCYVIL